VGRECLALAGSQDGPLHADAEKARAHGRLRRSRSVARNDRAATGVI
jgi:hypothetical protein